MAVGNPAPSRFPNGVGNVMPKHLLANYGLPDPSSWHTLFDDFDIYNTTMWSLLGSNTPTAAIQNAGGGQILLTTGATSTNQAALQTPNTTFLLVPGLQVYFRASVEVSALTTTFLAGLVNGSLSGLAPTDGIWFSKATATGQLVLNWATAAGTLGGNVTLNTTAVVGATPFLDIGFFVDANSNVYAFCGPTGRPVSCGNILGITQTAVLLAPTIGITTTTAAAKTMTVNYIMAAVERPAIQIY